MFTVELVLDKKPKNSEVEVFLDEEGIDLFIQKLQLLKLHGGHVHFMTPAWSGNELTEDKQRKENILINHLCIMLNKK